MNTKEQSFELKRCIAVLIWDWEVCKFISVTFCWCCWQRKHGGYPAGSARSVCVLHGSPHYPENNCRKQIIVGDWFLEFFLRWYRHCANRTFKTPKIKTKCKINGGKQQKWKQNMFYLRLESSIELFMSFRESVSDLNSNEFKSPPSAKHCIQGKKYDQDTMRGRFACDIVALERAWQSWNENYEKLSWATELLID